MSVFLDDNRVFLTTGDLILKFMLLCILLSIPIWFWSLIDRILKPEEFFIYYPSDTMTVNNNSIPQIVSPKSKTAAIVLSILFNYFSWLYTYRSRESKYKFWISVIFITILSLFTRYFAGQAYSQTLDSKVSDVIGLGILFSIPIWVWSLIDKIIKPSEFYSNYPNGK